MKVEKYMPKSKLKILYIIILILIVGVEIATLINDPSNTKLLIKGAYVIVIYICAIFGFRSRNGILEEMRYKSNYRDIIGDAFKDDRKARKSLLRAISLYNDNRYDAAVALLDSLHSLCISPGDYSAVLMFRALCFSERDRHEEAIAAYEELLMYDNSNSRAWSNLGLNYKNAGCIELAENAYRNAIRVNSKNAYAYANLAALLLDKNEAEEALAYTERALEINNEFVPALSVASPACTKLGEQEKAKEYFRRRVRKGSDK